MLSSEHYRQLILESIHQLPPTALMEVVDFIDYMKQKTLKNSINSLSDSIILEGQILSQHETNHLEEEFKDYAQHFPHD
jgi:hypothetical protein